MSQVLSGSKPAANTGNPPAAESKQYPLSPSLLDASVYTDPARYEKEMWTSQNERDWQHFVNVLAEDTAVINGWGTLSASGAACSIRPKAA